MRYIGCKSKLLTEISRLITDKNLNNQNYTFCDAFSGTGSVADYFKSTFKIIANDIQYYSFVISQAKLNAPDKKFKSLGYNPFEYFNNTKKGLRGFIYENYSKGGSDRMYFSTENAEKIDFIRTTIETWHNQEKISDDEYFYLLACLLESVSKVANVAGVYGSFLRKWDPRAVKPIKFIPIEQESPDNALFDNEVYNQKIEKLINDISGDILYLDPPYTHNQYSVQYHLLETIARYDCPEISGKGGLRDTSTTSSDFSRKGAVELAFEYIIAKAKFKYIILSYSSDGIMSEKFIESVLKRYGKPETFEKRKIFYKTYQNHKTTTDDKHQEYLFFIEKKETQDVTYASPLNYQGGKYDLIDFIKKHLPKKDIYRFIDLFGGGYNVGINIDAEQIIYNDYNQKVKELIEMFRNEDTGQLISYITKMVKKYGLQPNAKEPYLKLRALYNSQPSNERSAKLLYLLILYGFNQQIRFNSSYECNNPVGPAGFNEKILEKLTSFCRRIKEQNLILRACDFAAMPEYMTPGTFVYCDPPYYVTLGSYNDGKRGFCGWDATQEQRLYDFLDALNKNKVNFMLSNVLEHKGKENYILKGWLGKNNYNVYEYGQSARGKRKEILVTNYKED